MHPADTYLLGRAAAEEQRLRRQIENLAPDSEAHFDALGIRLGERVVDLGCGPGGALHLLARRVGAHGRVLGIERSPRFVELARAFVAEQGLANVAVEEGDAYATGLPRASFDGAHMRLVLVNVPQPERIVREMVALVRPGGWVASFEADFAGRLCDPPHAAWTRLLEAYVAHASAQGIDLFVGRRTHRMFRVAGVVQIGVDALAHVYPPGHDRRTIALDFINNVKDKLVEGGFVAQGDLDRDVAALHDHLADPTTLVTGLFFRLRGRVGA